MVREAKIGQALRLALPVADFPAQVKGLLQTGQGFRIGAQAVGDDAEVVQYPALDPGLADLPA